MAFTAAQEEILSRIIEAFKKGKRLSELPDNLKSTDPFNLIIEVLDIDGESRQSTIASLLPYIEEHCAYGIEYDTTISTPLCNRVGNLALHRLLPIQNKMRGCLLNDEGEVVEYLNPADWTNQRRDGSVGQVMVEIPMHYRRFTTNGNKRRIMLSEFAIPGYHLVPKHYASAYEATLQHSTNKLASVANNSADYRGGNNNASWDGTYRSLLGRPATRINRSNFRDYARNRKPGSTEWNCMTYDVQKTLFWLFAVEYANLNPQSEYTAEPTPEGYRQGGLGAGITNLNDTKWNSFNGYYPFIPCGYTDRLGNGSGVVSFDMPTEYNATTVSISVPRYRGIENPFGHIWQWTDGINIRISPTTANGGDGLSKVFVCSNPEYFTDNGYDGYHLIGNEARNDGYTKEIIFGEEGDIISAICTGGGSTTFFCDYHYTNIPTTETLRGIVFGGAAHGGVAAGLIQTSSINLPTATYTYVGTRLCFLPTTTQDI